MQVPRKRSAVNLSHSYTSKIFDPTTTQNHCENYQQALAL